MGRPIRNIFKLLLIIFFKLFYVSSQNYNLGVCADAECSVPMALGVTTINYNPPDGSKLGFLPNQEVIVFVKDYGVKKDLFGVELEGKKGYIPKIFVRETKSLAKVTVPALVEFMHTPSRSLAFYQSSHLPLSSNIPSEEPLHTTVPNTFNPQQSMQSIQHSGVHLESSPHHALYQSRQHWHSDHSHFHASSDVYIAKNADSRNYNSQNRDVNYQTPHINSANQPDFGSENTVASNFMPNAEMRSHSDNSIPSFQSSSPESHSQHHSSQFQSQPNIAHSAFSENLIQDFDLNSNNLLNSQRLDPQSNMLHHTQAPQTTPQLMSQTQFGQSPTEMNFPQANSYDKEFDETMALLQNQGYNSAGEFTNLQSHFSERQSDSVHSENLEGINADMNINKPSLQSGHTPSHVSSDQNNLINPSSFVKLDDIAQIVDSLFTEDTSIDPSESTNMFRESASQFDKRLAAKIKRIREVAESYESKNEDLNKIEDANEVIDEDDEDYTDYELIYSSKPMKIPVLDKTEINSNLGIESDQSNALEPEKFSSKSELSENMENLQTEQKSEIQSSPTGRATVVPTDSTNKILLNDIVIKADDPEKKMESINEASLEKKMESNKVSLEKKMESNNEVSLEKKMESNNEAEKKMESNHEEKIESNNEASLEKKMESDNKVSLEKKMESSIEASLEKEMESNKKVNLEKEMESNKKVNIEKEMKSKNEDTNEERHGTMSNNLSDIDSSEFQNPKDVSVASSTLEKLDSSKTSSLDKQNDSLVNTEVVSDEKDFFMDHQEKTTVNDIENMLSENVDSYGLSNDSTKADSLLNVSDSKDTEDNLLNAYQTRHLKDVESDADSVLSTEEPEQTGSSYEFDIYVTVENTFIAIRTFIDALLPWIPEPIFTIIMDLEKEGISPKVAVFTEIIAIPCIILIVSLVFIKGKSKENKLNARLTILERNFYNLSAEKVIVEEKLEKADVELQISRGVIEEEKILSFKLKTEIESLKQQLEETNLELEKNVDEVETMKRREHEYVELIHDHEKEHLKLLEQRGEAETKAVEFEETLVILRDSLQEKETEIQKLLSEKSEYRQANEIYEDKVSLLQKNCNQLLQEAEVWDLRVKELTEKLSQESLKNEELEKSMLEKNIEIESLSEAVQLFKTFEEIGESDNAECKTSEEKLKYLKNSTHNLMKLQKLEEENRLLAERLTDAKNRLLDIEVAIMDVKSENDKLKVNYNQALQDKAEALTKLEVLTNYFKDKEIQMQRQLGVQEAVRQKTEEDASSAERRICLIEQENSSYKYQVASMKQEIEETERNLKSQIALQEKKAHENWLAARTAERKLEDTKQEIMQLRQRLTLLEREQENWANSTRDEIIRPVPKRISNMNDDTINTQDSNSSLEIRPNIFHPPPPPMMLPPDRPLPPLPPLPPFLPPFRPPQPWNMPPPDPLPNSDFRMTPSDYGRGRESTPPRGRNFVDGELGPRQSSPIADLKDSRNSTPPHLLPDFHDIPPHPSGPFYPPPPMGPRTRYPMPPPRFPPTNFRRDYPGSRRIDNQEENNSTYGSQNAPVPPDDWHNSNTRV